MTAFVLFNIICGVIAACTLYGSMYKSFPFAREPVQDGFVSVLVGLLGVLGLICSVLAIAIHSSTKFGFKIPFTK